MEEPTHRLGNREGTDYTKVLLSASLSTLAWMCGALIFLGGVVIRLWIGDIDRKFQSFDTALGAETGHRIRLEVRTSKLEEYAIETRERDRRQEEILDDHKWKIETHQGDGHGWRSNGHESERRKR